MSSSNGNGRSPHEEAGPSSGKRPRDPSVDSGNDNKRSAPENNRSGGGRRKALFQIVHTKPHDGPTKYEGGQRVVIETNFFKLSTQSSTTEWKIYKYHVTFEPECLMKRMQMFLVGSHRDEIGGFLFDGAQLFTSRKLHGDDNIKEFETKTRDETTYTIRMKFTKIVLMSEQESLQVLNLILRRNMKGLNLAQVGRNFYDSGNMVNLHQFHIQLWPGYETSIRYHEDGILLNCDIAHKVMRTDTVYDMMKQCKQENPGNFRDNFVRKVLGMTVLTIYNNKTYRIDDVDFDKTPSSTFMRKTEEITISQYYDEKHKKKIRDLKQPLLISKPKDKNMRGGDDRPVWLVPELCYVTGLSEQQRNDQSLKGALKPYAQMNPETRRRRLMEFNNRIRSSQENARIRAEFGLEMEPNLVRVDGYCIGGEKLTFGINPRNGQNALLDLGDPNRDERNKVGWDRECGRREYPMYDAPELRRWVVISHQQMEREMRQLVKRIQEYGRAMNFEVQEPKWDFVRDDRELAAKVDSWATRDPRLILFGTPSNNKKNSDLYASIKKKCFSDYAIPSQVVTKFALKGGPKFDSVATKIAVQMCTKLGGAPWRVRCPLKNAMTIGFDIAKDANNKSVSYGCMVATMDLKQSMSFFSAVSRVENDCSKEIALNILKAISAYADRHEVLPSYIFIYRGGVGDGDLAYVRDIELAQINNALNKRYDNNPPKIVYMVVSKHINTRFWTKSRDMFTNPQPGTVVDNGITLQERYEFFLVSQKCGQGTVSPTNYNILYDTSEMNVERIQQWTFIHTHLYYNWYGTTRIPAVLQYANKLGFLVSNYMHRAPQASLCDRLFFL